MILVRENILKSDLICLAEGPQMLCLPGGTEGYPSQPILIRPSVNACRLGIERKMAQAQQIRSYFLQNHEST